VCTARRYSPKDSVSGTRYFQSENSVELRVVVPSHRVRCSASQPSWKGTFSSSLRLRALASRRPQKKRFPIFRENFSVILIFFALALVCRYSQYPRVSFATPGKLGYRECDEKTSYKVMVAFGEQTFNLLSEEARARGITIQELMRAVIIPDWFKARYEPVPQRSPVTERKIREEDPIVPYSYSNKLRY